MAAGQSAIRRTNLAVVLQLVAAEGECSRAGIALRTGLNKSTVSSLVGELIAMGLLAETGEEMAWGAGQARALDGLKRRVGGKEIAALCATLERSRRLGSPLADQLRQQSAGLRQDQKRAIEEEAARAAPKIQLVIALVLVPSVLLMIAASLIANSDVLLGGL